MGIHQRPRGTGRVLCCFVTLRPQGPRPGSQKELAGHIPAGVRLTDPPRGAAGFPFSPRALAGSALHVLVFRGAAWLRREHAALSVTAPAAGFGGLGAAAGREAFVPQQKQAPEWQPRQAGIKEPSRWMLATCPHRQLPLLPKDHASRCGSAPAPTAGVRTAHQGAQVASTLLGTENLPVSASCLL